MCSQGVSSSIVVDKFGLRERKNIGNYIAPGPKHLSSLSL